MTLYRPAAIAGAFYPASAKDIQTTMDEWLMPNHQQPMPKAAIIPHAGWRFSGYCAAQSYNKFFGRADGINTVFLFGPAHKVGFEGLGLSTADYWQTPEGAIALDTSITHNIVKNYALANFIDIAHAHEHCLEVHVPFITRCFPNALLVPILISQNGRSIASEIIKQYVHDTHSITLISSDLSHYNSPDFCRNFDDETAALIEANNIESLHGKRACGYQAIQSLLDNKGDLSLQRDYICHSGDAIPNSEKVVGYGAWTLG